MKNATTLIYDGTFNGFLSAIFIAFDERINVADIQKNGQQQNGLFSETKTIFTHIENAKRVWSGIKSKSHSAITNIYFSFLSEDDGVELLLYSYIQKIMYSKTGVTFGYSDGVVHKVQQLANAVGREKQRTEKLLGFESTKDNVRFAVVEPDSDILPLISKRFRNLYPNQNWFIFDLKRKYGIYYNQYHVEMVSLTLKDMHFANIHRSHSFLKNSTDYESLWNDHLKNMRIKPLINKKLHVQKVPAQHREALYQNKTAV